MGKNKSNFCYTQTLETKKTNNLDFHSSFGHIVFYGEINNRENLTLLNSLSVGQLNEVSLKNVEI